MLICFQGMSGEVSGVEGIFRSSGLKESHLWSPGTVSFILKLINSAKEDNKILIIFFFIKDVCKLTHNPSALKFLTLYLNSF